MSQSKLRHPKTGKTIAKDIPTVSIDYIPHTGQALFHLSEARNRIVCCGRKWGKTTMLIWEAFNWLGMSDSIIWWVSPYYNVSQIAYRRFLKEVPPLVIKNRDKRDYRIDMVNGSSIWFKCYDPETEVLTRDGFKPIATVDKSDSVATLSEDGYLIYQNPTNTYSYNYEGDMYRLKTRFIDLLVTPNHKLYVKPRGGEYGLSEAREVIGQRVNHKRNCLWEGEPQTHPDAYIELLGYYITEGHCEQSSIRITQKSSQEKRAKIENCIQKLGYEYTAEQRGFNIRSTDLRDRFKELGSRAQEKHLPDWATQLNKRQLRILFDSMILGDGYIRNNGYWGIQFYTTSKKLADQFQEIILKLGYTGIVRKIEPAENDQLGYTIHSGRQYHISVSRRTFRPIVNPSKPNRSDENIEEITPYSGKIHCIEVPNHVILVRRNGKIVWCGNSADNPDALVGEGIDFLLIDEAARVKQSTWLQTLQPNLADPRRVGYACMASTPIGHNWFYEAWMRGIQKIGDWESWDQPLTHLPITQQPVEQIRGGFPSWKNPEFRAIDLRAALELPPNLFLQEYGARFISDLGGVFPGHIRAQQGRNYEPATAGEEYYVGVDLAKTRDWTAVAVINSIGHLVYLARFRQRNWNRQVRDVIDIAREYNEATMLIDATGLGDPVYDFIKERYPHVQAIKLTNQSKRDIIENLALAINTGKFTYPEEAYQLGEELNVFGSSQTPAGNIKYEAPQTFTDDCVIAAALAVWLNVKIASTRLGFEFFEL